MRIILLFLHIISNVETKKRLVDEIHQGRRKYKGTIADSSVR